MRSNVPDITAGQSHFWHIWHIGTRPILNLIKERRILITSNSARARRCHALEGMKRTMKRIIIALTTCALLLTGCATKIVTSQEALPTAKYDSAFLAVRDVDEPTRLVEIAADVQAAEDERKAAEESAAAELETYYEEDYGWMESYSPSYSGDGFMQEGVRAGVDSDTETWYSSNAAYHYRTGEWTPDDEGYYRDSDGYYVVASNDYAEGTVVNTSKGEAKVYDSGTDSGNIDMYVNW